MREKALVFPKLGVQVRGGEIWQGDRLLGPLAGARAVVTGGQISGGRRVAQAGSAAAMLPMSGPIPLVAVLASRGYGGRVSVACSNGRALRMGVNGRADFQAAQSEAARFNVLASAAQEAGAGPS
jgi:hypothetical protein